MANGFKTGGRAKGTPNKAKPADAAIAAACGVPAVSEAAPAAGPAFPKYRTERTDKLIPYARNARTHSPAQIDALCRQIEANAWTNPILVAGVNILAGHRRRLAAMKLGMVTVPVIELSHLSAKQRRAYIIWDNKLALDAGWDDELLALELGELRDGGFDMTFTGFDAGELADLFDEPDLPGPEPEPRAEKPAACPKCGFQFAGDQPAARKRQVAA